MERRFELRELYIAGWYEKNAQKLLDATAPDFIFDDPAEAIPVPRVELPAYMDRWFARTGGMNEWIISHAVRKDKNGILTDRLWWEVAGTGLCGSGLVITGNKGVFMERITYFTRH
jgi:hypothetical protein